MRRAIGLAAAAVALGLLAGCSPPATETADNEPAVSANAPAGADAPASGNAPAPAAAGDVRTVVLNAKGMH